MKTVEGRRPIVKNKVYAPATGIQADFEKLLTSFVETKSVRYEEFAKLWREKKMSLICAGRQSDREVVEFMEECMKIAFKMFLPPYGFQARVGALYLLYGLYFTQPCLPKVKIRVTKANWLQGKALQEELIKENHHDTNFILHRLMAEGAFYFCAVKEETRNRYTHFEDSDKGLAEALREDRQSIDELFSEGSCEQLGLIHSQYHRLKVRLAGPDASRPDRSLDVLNDKFPSSVSDILQKHHDRWNKKEASRQGKRGRSLSTIPEQGEPEADSDHQPRKNVGQRRALLKAMAFRGAKNKQRYKHRTLIKETTPEKSPRKKGQQKGVKARGQLCASEMEEVAEGMVSQTSGALFHMPQLAEDADLTGNPSEKKRKGKNRLHNQESPAKKKKMADSPKSHTVEEEDGELVKEMEETVTALKEPKKRGRPSKSDASSPNITQSVVIENEQAKQTKELMQPPRKRGRPSKSDASFPSPTRSVDVEQEQSENTEETMHPPRKRGRPSKSDASSPSPTRSVDVEQEQSENTEETMHPPRKRGRPSKSDASSPSPTRSVVVENEQADQTVELMQPPRKRGRPPKSVASSPSPTRSVVLELKLKSVSPRPAKGKVGRPRKLIQSEDSTISKAKWRVSPLKVKDAGKLKKTLDVS